MTFQGQRVLVTGGMGFIGSHLVERLVEEGTQVRVLGRYNSRGDVGWLDSSPSRKECECLLGDIRDYNFVRNACQNVDIVFHLAALIGIPYSYVAPNSYVETNVQGTLNVLQAVRETSVSRLVHTSTSEVYGSALYVPISEEHPLQGQSPYSATKIAADKLVESYYRSFDLPVVTARPFNTFGPRQSTRAVIPTIIQQALQGENVRLGSLTPTRDFNYVSNTVDGFLALAKADGILGKTYNLGYGKEISIGDLANLIFELVGRELPVESEEARMRPEKSEVDRLLADNSLARADLGWEPKVSLKEGLERTIEWTRANATHAEITYAI